MAWSSLIVEVGEGSYQPNCQTNLVIVISGRAGSNLTCVIMFGIKETRTIFYLFTPSSVKAGANIVRVQTH